MVRYEQDISSHHVVIFQVKYVRRPQAEKEPHKWLLGIIQDEVTKVKSLIERGAKEYYLITNISGTSHLDVGSIDLMNKNLANILGIPCRCWWRDDLNRRLDNAWDLKWSYPELMTGPDLIRSVIESAFTEDRERRSSAIKAFVLEQFHADQLVKFKQVDLQNRLLDLFVDVPIVPPLNSQYAKRKNWTTAYIYDSPFRFIGNDINLYSEHFSSGFPMKRENGSATYLLSPRVHEISPWIVLEGAPGQGKSTITQYICQVHRMRLLDPDEIKKNLPDAYKGSESLEVIPEEHRSSHMCIPFRIDLRDLASWLSGQNPFNPNEPLRDIGSSHKSLEEFLAFHVDFTSGGLGFSASDLVAIAKKSNFLIVFDGLDEVADIQKRHEVVNTIHKGSRRLKNHAYSLQIIVTSRPAAFANSPGLPEKDFPRYSLDSLNKELIDKYAAKWMAAKKLDSRDRAEVQQILRDKLDQPHIKDLAKNPMQLTILLSLIYNRGASLPDKRTALYDNYVDLFFSREAEKTPVVRRNRDLLLGIHKYIAWVLHAEAECLGKNGSITQAELHQKILDFLNHQGHETTLVDELITGALERIVALVSRVEGTYEFEVQPLREYFAARHLYETARHSSICPKASGTKPDRFDAIARNFYWLNVTRFYAGCYDIGELPSLIDRLEELNSSEGYCYISHPRTLAAILLGDWVFSQHPKSTKKVMDLILDGIGLRYILPSASRRAGQGHPMILPEDCGKDELISHCFKLLSINPPLDFALDVIDLIQANKTSNKEIFDFWLDCLTSKSGLDRTKVFEHGFYLGLLSQPSLLSLSQLKYFCSDIPLDDCRAEILYRARRFDYFESTEDGLKVIINLILDRRYNYHLRRNNGQRSSSLLDHFNQATDAILYAYSFQNPRELPLSELFHNRLYWIDNSSADNTCYLSDSSLPSCFDDVQKCINTIDLARQILEQDAHTWATRLDPWNDLVETIRHYWGDVWICFHLANIASGIKSTQETCSDYSAFLSSSLPLCKRIRFARLKAGHHSWWANQIRNLHSESDKAMVLLVLITWASSKTIIKIIISIEYLVDNLSEPAWSNVFKSAEESLNLVSSSHRITHVDVTDISHALSPRAASLISLRMKQNSLKLLYSLYLKNYNGSDPLVLRRCYDMSIAFLSENYNSWNDVKNIIQKCYSNDMVSQEYESFRSRRMIASNAIPHDVATEILAQPCQYPGFLVALAEANMKERVAAEVVPVAQIAERDGWFEHL